MNREEAAAEFGMIIDRTERDVEYARNLLNKGVANMTDEEKETFLTTPLKGVYNFTDLNRVENLIWSLDIALNAMGYPVDTGEHPAWESYSFPTVSQLDALLLRVQIIRQAFVTFPNTPDVPDTMRFFTYEQANAIERILCDVIALFWNMFSSLNYSGEMYGGEM